MKFTCEKGLLQAACTIASRATASKSPIPALEGLLIEARADVKITGYDLKEGIYTNIQADVAEGGSVVVGARFFGEMIRRLPDGFVTISVDRNNSVKVKCGKSEFNFMGISPEDYPEMPVMDAINTISLPQNILHFLSLICLQAWVAFVWLCKPKGVNVSSHRSGMFFHRKHISQTLAICLLAT